MKKFIFLFLLGMAIFPGGLKGANLWSFSCNPKKGVDVKAAYFEILIKGGSVKSLNRIPEGWSLKIDGSENGSVKISGWAIHGGSYIDLSYFKNFLTMVGFHPTVDFFIFSMVYDPSEKEFKQIKYVPNSSEIEIKKVAIQK